MSVDRVSGIQEVMEIIESRTYKAPRDWRSRYGVPTTAQLDSLIVKLREADNRANYPVMTVEDFDGSNWLLGMGAAEKDGKLVNVYITTDHVRASELRGDAFDDAACYVAVRNALPAVVALLEELLERRTATEAPANG